MVSGPPTILRRRAAAWVSMMVAPERFAGPGGQSAGADYSGLQLLTAVEDGLAPDHHHSVPGDLDRVLDAFVGGTATRMERQRPFCPVSGLGGHRKRVAHPDRLDADGLPHARRADDTAVHCRGERGTVNGDLTPCQGASKSAVHSPGDRGHDVIEGRSDRGTLFRAVILAECALDAVDDRLFHLA